MQSTDNLNSQMLARYVGWSLLGTIIIGIISAFLIAEGIDINLTADVRATAENMLEAETRLRAKAYIAGLLLCLGAIVSVGLYLLLRKSGELLASASLFVSLVGSILTLLGAVFALNAAEIAGDVAYGTMARDTRLTLASLQATSDYTSFHLGLVLSTVAMAGFFYLFLKSGLIPKIIAGWGVFASLFVVTIIVARDFIPILGHGAITVSFMLFNMIAMVSLALYLSIWGVRGD